MRTAAATLVTPVSYTHLDVYKRQVVSRVFPAGAVVAVITGEQAQKRVRVIIIAGPTGTREVKIQMGLRGIKDFRLQLTQIHLNAEFVMPHLLQFNGNVFMELVSPAGRALPVEGRGSVSYTHLDVYKRQVQEHGSRPPTPFGHQ